VKEQGAQVTGLARLDSNRQIVVQFSFRFFDDFCGVAYAFTTLRAYTMAAANIAYGLGTVIDRFLDVFFIYAVADTNVHKLIYTDQNIDVVKYSANDNGYQAK